MTDHDRALVILGNTETERRLLGHAGEHAQGCGVDLVLLDISWEVDSGVGRKASLILERATGRPLAGVPGGPPQQRVGEHDLRQGADRGRDGVRRPRDRQVDRERRVER